MDIDVSTLINEILAQEEGKAFLWELYQTLKEAYGENRPQKQSEYLPLHTARVPRRAHKIPNSAIGAAYMYNGRMVRVDALGRVRGL